MTSLLSPGAAVPAGCFALEFESGATACWLFSHGVLSAHNRSDSSAPVSYSGPSPTRLAWSSRPHAYLIQWPPLLSIPGGSPVPFSDVANIKRAEQDGHSRPRDHGDAGHV